MADKLNVKALAIGIGVPWALCVLAGGWLAQYGWATGFVQVFQTVYIGYGPSFIGGIIGGIEAFFDGAVAGIIVAYLYNWAAKMK